MKKVDLATVERIKRDEINNSNCSEIEKSFELLGVTGVEDMLQEDVQKCLIEF
jgi:magnesium-transporting ATPase (P-type)